MKVLPVQNNFSVQKRHNSLSFGNARIDACIREIETPNTEKQVFAVWAKLFNKIRTDSSLKIVNSDMYNSLKQTPADCLGAFFYKNNIENKPDGYKVDIVKDADERLLSYGKDYDGQYLEVSSDEGFRRVGITYPEKGGSRYMYYQAPDVFVDFYHQDEGGTSRRIRTKALGGENTIHCDENGDSTIVSNVKGFFRDLSGMFDRLKKL